MAFMDSRARDLQRQIDDGEYLGIREFKGATLRQLTNQANKHLERYLFDVTYVAGGVCNITSKAEATDRISFEWDPPEKVVEHLKWTLKKADEFMKEHHPPARVVFCPLVGVELQRAIGLRMKRSLNLIPTFLKSIRKGTHSRLHYNDQCTDPPEEYGKATITTWQMGYTYLKS